MAWVQGGPVVLATGPVVLVVDPLAWAGIELAHPGNCTVRVNDPTAHVQSEKVMLEAAVVGSGGLLIVEDVAPDTRWSDLSVFERCVQAAASVLRRQAMS